ncbi:NlpC/P60 family protein [Polymorphospora rubra]|uniref:C40 family peptidase n=1 Tax=Polymorphospora rubra TaxID=338584 RepID=UPI0033D918BC
MTLEAGRNAVVRVAVATLWASPETTRAVDAPALADRTDIPAWISAMNRDQQVGQCVLSQLLLGERVLVEEVRSDGWARVVAVEQPAAKLDPRGYPGWLPTAQLSPAPRETPPAQPLVVDATTTSLHADPAGELVLDGVILGTRLLPAGPARDGWRPVHAPGHRQPLWTPDGHLVPVSTRPPTADEVLAMASRLRDVVYIWGGVSAYGVDCSGLVHLAWRRFGVRLPRDADDQADATTPLLLGAERPGDLYFFARPGRPIHHIGIVTAAPDSPDRRRMLHACYMQRRVIEEPLSADRAATLVGAHRV